MADIKNLDVKKTPMALAKEELAEENSRKAVTLLKSKLKELQAAELVVKNIEREIEDLNERVNQGDV